jgi:hypothetical protein
MSRFRDRPLTWLFILATACLELLAIASLVDDESDWFGAIAVGQMCLVGALLAAGQAHRLLRAALFLGVPLLVTIPDYLAKRQPPTNVASYVLGMSLVLSAMAAFFSFATIAVNAICVHRPADVAKTKFQFPIIEFFGWTIVVAVATLALRAANVGWLDSSLLAQAAAFVAFPATLIAYFYAPRRTWFLKSALVAAAAVSLSSLFAFAENMEWLVVLGAYAYVAGWLLIRRMDEAMCRAREVRAAHAEPPAKPSSPLAEV